MELILKEDVQNLGFKDDVVKVKNGYGRNFLIPQGQAILATASAKKVLAENLKQRAYKEKSIILASSEVSETYLNLITGVSLDRNPSTCRRARHLPIFLPYLKTTARTISAGAQLTGFRNWVAALTDPSSRRFTP